MNTEALSRANVGVEAARALPQISERITEAMERFADEPRPLNYAVFMTSFTDYMLSVVKGGDDRDLAALFEFIERMSSSSDAYVRDLASTVVLEYLIGWANASELRRATTVMGPATRGLYQAIVDSGGFASPGRG